MNLFLERTIEFENVKYDFIMGNDALLKLKRWTGLKGYSDFLIISDELIPKEILNKVKFIISEQGKVNELLFKGGEESKTLLIVNDLAEKAIELGINRKTLVIAVGGGLVGNVAGMLAGLLYRGLPLVHVPTTLMAASDSVLSLKQAVNLKSGKNLVGLFYSPKGVYVDSTFIKLLPKRHIQAGLYEVIKNLLIIDPEKINEISNILKNNHEYSEDELVKIVDFCIDSKMKVMKNDKNERYEGLALEYGHTIGHSLELAAKGLLFHGECVAFGMLCAAEIGYALNFINKNSLDKHYELIEKVGFKEVNLPANILSSLMDFLVYDNKKGYVTSDKQKIGMILMNNLGEMRYENNFPITLVDIALIHNIVEKMCKKVGDFSNEQNRMAKMASVQ